MKNTKITLLSIAIIAALPFAANATQTIVETNTPAAVGANGTVKKAAATGPYQTATIGEHDDEHIATTAYVKGAYNDAIAAVNKVDDSTKSALDNKQAKLVNETSNHIISADVTGVSSEIIHVISQMQPRTRGDIEELLPAISEDLGINYDDTLISTAAAIDLMATTLGGLNLEAKQNQLELSDGRDVSDTVMTVGSLGNNRAVESLADDLINDEAGAGVVADDIERQYFNGTYHGVPLVSLGGVLELIGVTAREVKSEANTELASKRVTIYTTWGNDTSAATTQVPFTTAQ